MKSVKHRFLAIVLVLVMLFTVLPTAVFADTVGLATDKSNVKADDEIIVTVKVPSISSKLVNFKLSVQFDKDAFEVIEFSPNALAGSSLTSSTLEEAKTNGVIVAAYNGNSGENAIDLSSGYTLTAKMKVLSAAVSGEKRISLVKSGIAACKFESFNEETYETIDHTPTGMVDSVTVTIADPTPAHIHEWDTAWKTNATHHWHDCTADGCPLTDADNTLKGSYGVHIYDQAVATDAHKKSDATHTKKATYYKSCICGVNGTEIFESGETVPHTFNQENTDNKYLKSEATCQAKAVYYYSCICGEIGTETFEYGEKTAHSYETGWTSDGTNHYHRCLTEGCTAKDGQEACSGGNPATCQAKSVCATCKQPYGNLGAHTYTTDYKLENADSSKHYHVCTICNLKDTGEAHIADRSEATETDPVKCTKCDYVMTPALGHICKNHLTKHEAKNADCTNNGNREYYECTCGKYYSDANAENEITDHNSVIIPAGHKFTAVIAEVPATCTKTGTLAHRDCAMCEKHFATDSATELKNLVIPANGHKTTLVAKVDSTCTAVGTKEHYKCTVCEKLFQDAAGTVEATEAYLTIAKKAHTLIPTPAKAPTCVSGGNDAYWTCSVCGNVYSDETGTTETSVAEMTKGADANAHDLEKVPAVASTCKVQGHGEYYKCKLCGKMFDKNTDDKQELTTITLLPLAAHDYGTYYSDANSHWQFCKVCGDKKSAAHTPGADATDTTSQVCQDCGAVLKKATGTTECGHKEQAPGFNANDTQHWHYCANCGERIGDAKNHNFGAEKVVKEATKTETGLKTKTCATCGWVQQTVIPATGGNTTPGGNGGTGGGFPFKDSNKTNNTGKVESQKTFDGGIALYVGLSVLSLTGSALVIRKKKEF